VESIAWIIAGAAGISIGVIAGLQHEVTANAVVAISAVIAVAVGALSRILPRHADRVPDGT
jgi:hypothetical protein